MPSDPSDNANPVMHAKMYALGSKYDILDLKQAAQKGYKDTVSTAWNGKEFARAIRLAYTTTPEEDKGLRDITSQTILQHREVLLAKEEIEAAVRSIERLPYALLQQSAYNGTCIKTFECDDCSHEQPYFEGSSPEYCHSCGDFRRA